MLTFDIEATFTPAYAQLRKWGCMINLLAIKCEKKNPHPYHDAIKGGGDIGLH